MGQGTRRIFLPEHTEVVLTLQCGPGNSFQHLVSSFLIRRRKKNKNTLSISPWVCFLFPSLFPLFFPPLALRLCHRQSSSEIPSGLYSPGESSFRKIRCKFLLYIHPKNRSVCREHLSAANFKILNEWSFPAAWDRECRAWSSDRTGSVRSSPASVIP